MTVHAGRRRTLLGRVRLAGAVTAALALASLIAIGPPTSARAATPADGYNQMTGSGNTASALTVKWTSGLLNAENQPITTAGTELSPNSDRQAYAVGQATTSPLSFMYADFKNIQVSVTQTDNISHQGITVGWSGAAPGQEFMQLMECWGDADTGPSPENCEFGSQGMLPHAADNQLIGNRGGNLCTTGSVASATNPPKLFADPHGDPGEGCDPYEPTSESPAHCNPDQTPAAAGDRCSDGTYEIPFVGVDDPTHPIYDQGNLPADFNEFNSNENQYALTTSGGTGQLQFETLTSVEAPHLGCGELEANGKPRGCWLVIVPRGNFEPNGWKLTGGSYPDGELQTSPLSAGNWAQRIQIHLSYAPLGTACPPTVLPDQVVGTQVITRAVNSWELALNLAANCNTVYAFTETTENEATSAIRAAGPGSGSMAFTAIPIGSETTRFTGGTPPGIPKVLYAPVAVTAMGFGFNINENSGYVATPVKLTPQLLARALTQVYRTDLPDYGGSLLTEPGPAWAQKNPPNITEDPAFAAVNAKSGIVPFTYNSSPLAPLLTEDHSQLNQQVWQWVQSDPATVAWLDKSSAAADAVQSDPDYVSLSPQLGKTPAQDSFPRAYSGSLDLGAWCAVPGCTAPKERKLLTANILPYAPDIGTAAAWVLGGQDTANTNNWDPYIYGSDGTLGSWDKVGVETPGTTFMWALSDTPDLASYGLIAAQLCGPTGATCVGPTLDSVAKTLNAATADSAGLLEVNPAKVPAGGYPLVQVVYAAVPTNQGAQSLTHYANLIKYAVNQGQTVGSSPGDLPPGYLPLTAKLQAQANAVVAKLQKLANPTPTTSPTPTRSPSASSTPTSTTSAQPTSSATTQPTQTQPAIGTTPPAGATPTVPSTLPALPTSSACVTTPAPSASSTSASTATASATPGSAACGNGASPSATGPLILPPSTAQLASGTTQGTVVSNIRLVLVSVLIIGAVGSVTGTVLRTDWRPRRRRSRRPS
jgi:hypothetical protein